MVDELHEKTKIRVMKPQGTYLLWLDFSAYPYSDDELHAKIHDQAKLILNRGTDFGKEGNLHARLNVAALSPSLKKSPNAWWKLSQISVDFL